MWGVNKTWRTIRTSGSEHGKFQFDMPEHNLFKSKVIYCQLLDIESALPSTFAIRKGVAHIRTMSFMVL